MEAIQPKPGASVAPIYSPVFGQSIDARMVRDLDMRPVERYAHLAALNTLEGQQTGFITVYEGERIEKAVSLSMQLMPGLRYFLIHIVADPRFDIPRYCFDGLMTDQGSRVALDLYPEIDLAMNLEYLRNQCAGLANIYQTAAEDERFTFEASRLAHIRAICSPYFLGVFSAPDRDLPGLEAYADAYFGEWLKFFKTAEPVSAEIAASKRVRRSGINRAIIRGNYLSPVVTEIYGETINQAVVEAVCS